MRASTRLAPTGKMFSFKVTHKSQDSLARTCLITTAHGVIETPAFVPVATQGSVKTVTADDVKQTGSQVVIANTYHLHLRPGEDVIKRLGGIHKFMNWNGPVMTDSGGFQVFSLGFGMEQGVGKIANIFPEETAGSLKKLASFSKQAKLASIDDDGVSFTSHIDGKLLRLSPEISMEIQRKLGADIILAFDECTSPLHDYEYTKKAMERTHNWARRCLEAIGNKWEVRIEKLDGRNGKIEDGKKVVGSEDDGERQQAVYGIVQGGHFRDLREKSARFISDLPFVGLAIGGDLGRSKAEMHEILDWVMPVLSDNKPRHLLGIGGIDDIFAGVEKGIDTFDCVIPTRLARCGQVLVNKDFTPKKARIDFRVDITKAIFAQDNRPIDDNCGCYTCRNFSRAYLSHLFKAHELSVYRLLTIHNLYFMNDLLQGIRKSLISEKYLEFKRKWIRR